MQLYRHVSTVREYLLQKGIPESVVNKVFFENALNFFAKK